jgi:hypothetical protein
MSDYEEVRRAFESIARELGIDQAPIAHFERANMEGAATRPQPKRKARKPSLKLLAGFRAAGATEVTMTPDGCYTWRFGQPAKDGVVADTPESIIEKL